MKWETESYVYELLFIFIWVSHHILMLGQLHYGIVCVCAKIKLPSLFSRCGFMQILRGLVYIGYTVIDIKGEKLKHKLG